MSFTHFDSDGNAIMVDVGDKAPTQRMALACGYIRMSGPCFNAMMEGRAGKGDVLGAARIAGIMGAKKTSELVPLCHPLLLTKVTIDFETDDKRREVKAFCTVKTAGQTGVEMEALTGVSVALLTVYDMCKAMDKTMEIGGICLLEKQGGKSGHFVNPGMGEV